VSEAKLPTNYTHAKHALAKCERVDEWVKWKSQASALASYGRQMKDQDMIHMAQRILDRAIRRGGELLARLEKEKGGRPKTDAPRNISFRDAAIREAGLSPAQATTMLRVANVPEATFERMVEGKSPASVKQLADEGTRKRKAAQEPHREEYLDWCHAVRHLAALPACGLGVLAPRGPYSTAELIEECDDAIRNLKLWKQSLEKTYETDRESNAA
jgi:hypothetical protein